MCFAHSLLKMLRNDEKRWNFHNNCGRMSKVYSEIFHIYGHFEKVGEQNGIAKRRN